MRKLNKDHLLKVMLWIIGGLGLTFIPYWLGNTSLMFTPITFFPDLSEPHMIDIWFSGSLKVFLLGSGLLALLAISGIIYHLYNWIYPREAE